MQAQYSSAEMVRILITAKDTVQATVYAPAVAPKAVLVVHSATATPQGFYRAFAQHAAANGLVAITYDYRGTGRSGPPKQNSRFKMRDWIQQDAPAVAHWAKDRYPDLPHYAIGHSLGGHALVLGFGTEHLDAAAIISSHVNPHHQAMAGRAARHHGAESAWPGTQHDIRLHARYQAGTGRGHAPCGDDGMVWLGAQEELLLR